MTVSTILKIKHGAKLSGLLVLKQHTENLSSAPRTLFHIEQGLGHALKVVCNEK